MNSKKNKEILYQFPPFNNVRPTQYPLSSCKLLENFTLVKLIAKVQIHS